MQRRSILPFLLVAAAAWLVAGPVGLTLQEIVACRHDAHADAAHHSHDAPPPPGTPCFCDDMTGGGHVALAPALAAPAAIPVVVAGAERTLPFPPPSSPVPRSQEGPIPPPPNALA